MVHQDFPGTRDFPGKRPGTRLPGTTARTGITGNRAGPGPARARARSARPGRVSRTAILATTWDESPRPGGSVPQTTLWWVNGEEFLGRISIRQRLTAGLREIGGHIGYDIRPSARGRGHATAMLAAALPVVRSLGVDWALLTCDEDNIASAR
jgi:GNAT superfamily N-acetyltransferase